MARVAFLKHGMEVHTEIISDKTYRMGAPLPVDLVEAAQTAWAEKMGYDPAAGYITPGKTWESVRVGAQTFSHTQFLEAQKHATAHPEQAATPAVKPDNTPKVLTAPEQVPASWALLEEIQVVTTPRTKPAQEPGPVIDNRGQIDWEATKEANFRRDLAKIGAKPRPPKPDGP